MKTITINISKDNKVSIDTKGQLTLEEITNALGTAQLAAMNAVAEQVPEEHRQAAKEGFFDMYNIAASNTLAAFLPDKDLRPHLSEQAILEMENKIMRDTIAKQ